MYIGFMFILFIISISFVMFARCFSPRISMAYMACRGRGKYDFYMQSISPEKCIGFEFDKYINFPLLASSRRELRAAGM